VPASLKNAQKKTSTPPASRDRKRLHAAAEWTSLPTRMGGTRHWMPHLDGRYTSKRRAIAAIHAYLIDFNENSY
jgi:hypothetical protein